MVMGFFQFDSYGRLVNPEGEPVHIVGINYVASYICTNFWQDWRPERIASDLKRIAELGLNAIRIPMHWGYMEPEPGQYRKDFSEKFAYVIQLCRQYGLYVMPWFLAGIATEAYDVPFRNGESFFTGRMLRIARQHLQHFIEPYRDDPQILFWDICDEPEGYDQDR